MRGNGNNAIYKRNNYAYSNTYGFRVCRRYEAEKWENVKCEIKENFNGWTLEDHWHGEKSVASGRWKASNGAASIESVGVGNSKAVLLSNTMLYLPKTSGEIAFVRIKVKNPSAYEESFRFMCDSSNTELVIEIPSGMQDFHTIDFPNPMKNGEGYYFWADGIVDDIEIWTVPK